LPPAGELVTKVTNVSVSRSQHRIGSGPMPTAGAPIGASGTFGLAANGWSARTDRYGPARPPPDW
jgi:hypothetical protein